MSTIKNITKLRDSLKKGLALVNAESENNPTKFLIIAVKSLKEAEDRSKELMDGVVYYEGEIERLKGSVEKLTMNHYSHLLPTYMQSLRSEMALKSLFENIEAIGIEGIEQFVSDHTQKQQA